MSKQLTEAINALAEVSAWQLHELRDAAAERRGARLNSPDAIAALEAIRRPLRKTNFASVLTTPALAVPFERIIPGSFWSQVAVDRAEVACPCKESHVVTLAIPHVCECDRAYLYTGAEVRVARLNDEGEIEVVD